MSHAYSQVLIHLVFSTKFRRPILTPAIQIELHPYLSGVLTNHGCPSFQVGGIEDHLHLVFGLSRTMCISDVVELVKTSSSKWIKTKGSEFDDFHWQSGYAAFSVYRRDLQKVIRYIRNQPEHHKRETFQEEYRRLLIANGIEFDERYIWE